MGGPWRDGRDPGRVRAADQRGPGRGHEDGRGRGRQGDGRRQGRGYGRGGGRARGYRGARTDHDPGLLGQLGRLIQRADDQHRHELHGRQPAGDGRVDLQPGVEREAPDVHRGWHGPRRGLHQLHRSGQPGERGRFPAAGRVHGPDRAEAGGLHPLDVRPVGLEWQALLPAWRRRLRCPVLEQGRLRGRRSRP